jgi:hypothetical protein
MPVLVNDILDTLQLLQRPAQQQQSILKGGTVLAHHLRLVCTTKKGVGAGKAGMLSHTPKEAAQYELDLPFTNGACAGMGKC